jgi:hypothetical protein
MALVQLSLENLKQLKGGLAERMLNAALNRISLDLLNAPDIAEARKVTLEILAKPIIEDGELGDVIVEFAIGQKVPKRVTSARMVVRSATNGAKQLYFAVDSPDNPHQMTLPLDGDAAGSGDD